MAVGLGLKAIFVALMFVVLLIEFSVFGVLASTASESTAPSRATNGERLLPAPSSSSPTVFHTNFDHNYMASKRKVPNGPDPIHNRRTGDSKRPPGGA
ncbi:hypothetical protein Syun_020795 [Stephania yunnanensis]|uniref:Uncharacterized protein n=1 Tax=Stephania yunnanensis TaxID=152371 RepID=A0AAP0IEL0_9MAGN